MALPAQPIPAETLLQALRDCGVQYVLSVPDTHQKTLLAALDQQDEIKVITCSTEDEAVAAGAGMWIGGAPFALMIQHAGLYACVNNLRGVGIDMKVPLFMMIGLLGRELDKPPRENAASMVRLAEPLLDTLGISHYLVDGPDDVHYIKRAYDEAQALEQPVAVLIGAPTA